MQSQNKNCVHIAYVNIKHVSRIDSDFIDERRVLNENSRKWNTSPNLYVSINILRYFLQHSSFNRSTNAVYESLKKLNIALLAATLNRQT